MDQNQYRQFLNDPAAFMNAGPVRRLRINMVPGGPGFRNTVQFTANYPGAVPTFFQYSDSMVTPVSLRYDNTGIPATSALWAQTNRPANGQFVNDRAYYLQWNADQAYAITLGHEAQLFLTAQVDGCGILLLEGPQGLTVIHHNVQVAAVGQSFMQQVFESQANYNNRDRENRFDVRAQTLQALAQHIVAANPGITRGTALDARQYMGTGHVASVFGVKRGGRWRVYVNRRIGADYQTDLLYGQ
jgi:hypothetical protein